MTEAKTWQKTVLSGTQLDAIGYPILPLGDRTGPRRVAEAQAEITGNIAFRAGLLKFAQFISSHLVDAHASSGPLRLDIDLVQLVKQEERWGL